jgi:hypothetical protein
VKKISLIAFSMTLALSASAIAQEETTSTTTTTTIKKSDVITSDKAGKDIDDEITNARLRATTGSKKKLSIASSFSYAGAAITTPLSTERPQLNDGLAAADPARLNAEISLKYRLTENDHLNLGFGIDYTPEYVSNKTTGAKQTARTNASSPSLSYSRVFKAGIAQNVLSAGVTKYTAKEDMDNNLNYQVALSHTIMAPIGSSKAEIGLYSFFGQEFYSKLDDGQSAETTSHQIGIMPVFEYAISEKASFRTVSRWLTWTVMNNDKERGTLAGQTQSMGIGYAVTRDVYLYPNMQWKWSRLTADQTTVGFSANINL